MLLKLILQEKVVHIRNLKTNKSKAKFKAKYFTLQIKKSFNLI